MIGNFRFFLDRTVACQCPAVAIRRLTNLASKVIGNSVLNDDQETIGKIEELLVSSDGRQPYAVLSIGGFLGMGTHMIVIPYETLKFADDKVMLPEFKYATD